MEPPECEESSIIEPANGCDSSMESSTMETSTNADYSTPDVVDDNISESKEEEQDVSEKNDKVRKFAGHDYAIPELQKFDSEAVYRFLRKYGSFSKPHTLTNKERKLIKKFTDLKQSQRERRKDRPRPKRNRYDRKMSNSNCKQRIAFDLSYFNENLMRYIDMRMCVKQIHRCYSENRKLSDPLQFHIASVSGKGEEILSLNIGYKNWDVNLHKKSFLEVFKKEDIVYLTSESENVIDTIDDSKVYVIGGLLDHNSLKGLSYRRAIANNIAHGRLPIDKYMDMKKLKVLPINQVYSVISLIASGKSWSEALVLTIPQRKEATPKINEPTPEAVGNNSS